MRTISKLLEKAREERKEAVSKYINSSLIEKDDEVLKEKADAWEEAINLIERYEDKDKNEELHIMGETLTELALNFTSPEFEDYWPEWHTVYMVGDNLLEMSEDTEEEKRNFLKIQNRSH